MDRITVLESVPSSQITPPTYTTQRPLSVARFEGNVWAESLISQLRPAVAESVRVRALAIECGVSL